MEYDRKQAFLSLLGNKMVGQRKESVNIFNFKTD